MNKNGNPKKPQKPHNKWASYSGLAFQMGAIIGLGTWLGSWLDEGEEGFPLYTVLLSLASVATALYLVLRDVMKNS